MSRVEVTTEQCGTYVMCVIMTYEWKNGVLYENFSHDVTIDSLNTIR